VQSIEDELIDSYLAEELTRDEAQLFRRHFLISERHQDRMRLFELWGRAVTNQQSVPRQLPGSPSEVSSWWAPMTAAMLRHRTLAFACGLALALAVCAPWAFWLRKGATALEGSNQVLNSDLQKERAIQEKLQQQVDKLSREQGQRLASFVLVPSGTRGGGGKSRTIVIQPGIEALRFELPVLPVEHDLYSVRIETVEGRECFRQDYVATGSDVSAGKFNVVLSADLLANNDYVLTLGRLESGDQVKKLASFGFRLSRE